MIVDTMTWGEVTKELNRAYNIISDRHYSSPVYLRKLKRAFVKKEIAIGYYSRAISAEYNGIKTITVFRLESSEFCSVNLATIFRYRGRKYIATFVITTYNKCKVLIFTKHFLDRYTERTNTTFDTFEELARHILINENMSTMELNGEYGGKVITLTSGIGLSNSEPTDEFFIANTYVNNRMLKGDQTKAYLTGLLLSEASDELTYELNTKRQFVK